MFATKAPSLAAAAVMIAGSFAVVGAVGQNAGASAPAQADKLGLSSSQESRVNGRRITIAPGGNRIARVTCPTGTTVTGGGGQTSRYDIFLTDSYSPGGRTWIVRGTNTGTRSQKLWAYARCL